MVILLFYGTIPGHLNKAFFNRKERKVFTKNAKLKLCFSALCELCVKALRPLRLMDLDLLALTFSLCDSSYNLEIKIF
jgi:hypothetical protein